MEKRLAMLVAAEQPGVTVTELCAQMGVSRDSFYEWRRRLHEEGIEGLVPRSRRPHTSPNATPPEVEEAIVRLRKELPLDNGAEVIGWHLRRAGVARVPSDRTIHRVLVRRGMVVPEPQKRPRSSWRRFEFDRPNECWQIDATEWRLAGGATATVMDVLDDHSRVVTALRVGPAGATTELALEAFFAGVRRWGAPATVLSDRGACFAPRRATDGPSEFEATLAAVGVRVIHARAHHPQTCGKIERFHRTLKRWLAARPPAATREELQARLDSFADFYNEARPHRALGRLTPAERHGASSPAGPHDGPLGLPAPRVVTISSNGVRADGSITIGSRWRTSVGTEHAGRRLTVVRYGEVAVVLDGAAVLARLHLDPDRTYLPSGRPRGGPRRRPY